MLLPKLFFIPTNIEIQKIGLLFSKHFGTQMKDFWNFGLYTGLRVEELLQLRFTDLNVETSELIVCEKKNNKTISISHEALAIILEIKRKNPTDKFIFQSRRSRNVINIEPRPISSQVIYKAFKEVAEILNEKLSPRVMRQVASINLKKVEHSRDCIDDPKLRSEILKHN